MLSINKSEFSELMEEFELSQKVRCSKEETEKFNKALKANKVLDMFISCESIADKISIMKSQINSLVDLEDLLLDAEPSADEIVSILKSLSPTEIVALMKKYSPAYEMSFTELRDCEKTLCEGLYEFVDSLPSEQQAVLEKAVKALEVEGHEQL